jgi:hypothetical protein
MLHELNFIGWLIKISFSPSMAAAWVAADEEQCHPFFPPRGGLQYSRIKVRKAKPLNKINDLRLA